MPQGIFHIAKQYFIRVAYFTWRRQISLKKDLSTDKSFFWRRHPDLNWGWRCCRPLPYHLAMAPYLFLKQNLAFVARFYLWSGRRDSNSRRSPWQGDALPLSHSRIFFSVVGASGWNRTADTGIFSPLLYRLSYRGKFGDSDGARTHDLQRDRLAF